MHYVAQIALDIVKFFMYFDVLAIKLPGSRGY